MVSIDHQRKTAVFEFGSLLDVEKSLVIDRIHGIIAETPDDLDASIKNIITFVEKRMDDVQIQVEVLAQARTGSVLAELYQIYVAQFKWLEGHHTAWTILGNRPK